MQTTERPKATEIKVHENSSQNSNVQRFRVEQHFHSRPQFSFSLTINFTLQVLNIQQLFLQIQLADLTFAP